MGKSSETGREVKHEYTNEYGRGLSFFLIGRNGIRQMSNGGFENF
jgi:hypothetical protein